MSAPHPPVRRPPVKMPVWMFVLAGAGGAGAGWGFWRVTRWEDWSVTSQCVVCGVIGLIAGAMVFGALGVARWLKIGGRDLAQ